MGGGGPEGCMRIREGPWEVRTNDPSALLLKQSQNQTVALFFQAATRIQNRICKSKHGPNTRSTTAAVNINLNVYAKSS